MGDISINRSLNSLMQRGTGERLAGKMAGEKLSAHECCWRLDSKGVKDKKGGGRGRDWGSQHTYRNLKGRPSRRLERCGARGRGGSTGSRVSCGGQGVGGSLGFISQLL